MMKPSVIVVVILLITNVLCDDLNPVDNSNSTETNKSKRGVFGYHGYDHGYGHGLHYSVPHFHSTPHFHSSAHHLTPYAARFPTFVKSFHYPTGYALSHGSATVSSYNVNYPKYSFYSPKPHIHVPVHSPLPRPVIPTPPVVLAAKPVVPVVVHSPVVPTFTTKPIVPFGIPTFTNRVPFVVSKPVPAPFHPGPVAAVPSVPFGVQSPFIPFPVQPTINSFPAVTGAPSIPLPGTAFVAGGHQDPWHPLLVNQPATPTIATTPHFHTPTIATTPHFHRPAVNLLPPYGAAGEQSHQAQLELQQESFEGTYPDEHYSNRVSSLYLSPNPNSEKNQPLLQQTQFVEQDLSQGK